MAPDVMPPGLESTAWLMEELSAGGVQTDVSQQLLNPPASLPPLSKTLNHPASSQPPAERSAERRWVALSKPRQRCDPWSRWTAGSVGWLRPAVLQVEKINCRKWKFCLSVIHHKLQMLQLWDSVWCECGPIEPFHSTFKSNVCILPTLMMNKPGAEQTQTRAWIHTETFLFKSALFRGRFLPKLISSVSAINSQVSSTCALVSHQSSWRCGYRCYQSSAGEYFTSDNKQFVVWNVQEWKI